MTQKLEIVRGTSNTFQIEVRDADGNLYAATGGEKVIFGIKCKPEDPETAVVKTASMSAAGIYVVKLSPEDTEALKCGRYFYDVALQSGEDFYNIIESTPLVILANITKRGCAD